MFDGETLADLAVEQKNRAKELIEDFMIVANGFTARYLASKGFSFTSPNLTLAETVAADYGIGIKIRYSTAV